MAHGDGFFGVDRVDWFDGGLFADADVRGVKTFAQAQPSLVAAWVLGFGACDCEVQRISLVSRMPTSLASAPGRKACHDP